MSWNVRLVARTPEAVIKALESETYMPAEVKADVSKMATQIKLQPGLAIIVESHGHHGGDASFGGDSNSKVGLIKLAE